MEPTGGPPPVFAGFERLFPVEGRALEIACGRGATVVWLAGRGMEVLGVDVSPVAIDLARELALLSGVANRCRFEVHDLDEGLPAGPAVDLLLCHMFRDRRLDQPMMERLAPGGLLAVAALSEVGGGSGQFRAVPGELRVSFEPLEVIAEGEGDGVAWFMIMANWAAPETMITEEKVASHGENPAPTARTPYATPKAATATKIRIESRIPCLNDGLSNIPRR